MSHYELCILWICTLFIHISSMSHLLVTCMRAFVWSMCGACVMVYIDTWAGMCVCVILGFSCSSWRSSLISTSRGRVIYIEPSPFVKITLYSPLEKYTSAGWAARILHSRLRWSLHEPSDDVHVNSAYLELMWCRLVEKSSMPWIELIGESTGPRWARSMI